MKTYDIIIRVSDVGGRTSEAGYISPDDQAARCTAAIEGNRKARVGQVFDAQDVSGWVSVDSPVYRQALARVLAGQTAGFAFAYSSRIGRNVRAVARYFDDCEAAGADIVFADNPTLNYRTQDGRMITTIDGLMAERKYLESKALGERIADRKILEEGIANSCPFGYMRNGTYINGDLSERVDPERHGKALVPDPDQAPVVQRIFQMRVDGFGWVPMAKVLNDEGVPAPEGRRDAAGHWKVSTLRSVIRNEAYLGVARYKARKNPKAHAPLVPRKLWEEAQSTKTVQRNGKRAAGIAGGIVRCATCHRRMAVCGSIPYLTYGCRPSDNGGQCRGTFITKEHVDSYVEKAVLSVLEHGRGDLVSSGREIQALRGALDDAEAELEAYLDVTSARDRERFQRGLDMRELKVEHAQAAYEEAAASAGMAGALPDTSAWAAMDLDHRRRVARALISEVLVAPTQRPRAQSPENRLTILFAGAAH